MKNVDEVIQCSIINHTRQKTQKSLNQLNFIVNNNIDPSREHSVILSEKKLSNSFRHKRKLKFKLPQMKTKKPLIPELLKQNKTKKKKFSSNENLSKLKKNLDKMPYLKMKKLPMPQLKQLKKISTPKSEIERQFETPKYISVGKYNNYKYQSLHINYILREKEALSDKFNGKYNEKPKNVFLQYKAQLALKKVQMRTKNMPFHLQSIQKRQSVSPARSISGGSELRFELNEKTRQDLVNRSKGEFTTKELDSINVIRTNPRNSRTNLSTINSSLIMSKFDTVWKKYKARTLEDVLNTSTNSLHKK